MSDIVKLWAFSANFSPRLSGRLSCLVKAQMLSFWNIPGSKEFWAAAPA